MLKDFLNRLLELNKEPIIVDGSGIEYLSKGEYSEIRESMIPGFNTNTLRSIVDYVKSNFDSSKNGFVIHVENEEKVKLYSSTFGPLKQREVYVSATASIPEFSFGRFIDQESFVISMLSKFKESEGRDYALGVASNIVEDQEVKMIDNGLAQTAMFKSGVASVSNDKVVPYVNMIPYRTFIEVEQPASIFLLRLKKGGVLALYEADGGAWKQEAVSNIVEFFKAELEGFDYSIMS